MDQQKVIELAYRYLAKHLASQAAEEALEYAHEMKAKLDNDLREVRNALIQENTAPFPLAIVLGEHCIMVHVNGSVNIARSVLTLPQP